jgi:hypothetical protein
MVQAQKKDLSKVLSVRIICTNQEATLQVNPPTGAFLLLLRVAPSVSPPGKLPGGLLHGQNKRVSLCLKKDPF